MSTADDTPAVLPGSLLRLRSYRPDNGPALILSTADAPFSLENEKFPNGGTVYAETISTSSGAKFEGDVALYANRYLVRISADGSNTTVHINLSGRDSTDLPAEGTMDTATPGHNLIFYAESIQFQELNTLRFAARGGNGGNGYNSLISGKSIGGAGGNGAAGGEVTLVLGTPISAAIYVGRNILDSKYDIALNAQDAVLFFNERRQYVELLCELCTELLKTEKILDLDIWVDNLIALISLPWKVYPLAEERIVVRSIVSLLSGRLESLRTQLHRTTEVQGGVFGAGGIGTEAGGASGTNGRAGRVTVHFNNLLSDHIRKIPLPVAHPDQCYMLLELAKFNYFQDRREDCRIQLTRLRNRLIWVYDVVPDDSIYKAYAAAEPYMYLIPRPGITGTQLSSIESLRSIQTEVDSLTRQLASQVDYYGHSEGFVPRGSFNFYKETLEKILEGLNEAEVAHQTYFAANQKQEKRAEALVSICNLATDNISRVSTVMGDVAKVMKTQEILIRCLIGKMKTAQQELSTVIKRTEQRIAALTPSIGLDLMDLVEAASMLCFCPSPPMIITQSAGLGYKAWSKSGVKKDNGEMVKQDLLLEGFRSIEATTTSLIEGYNEYKENQPLLEVDDPSATKLIADKAEMEQLLGGFTKTLKKESLDELSNAFHNYIQVTIERNNAIMQYNAAANLWYQKKEALNELEVQKTFTTNPTVTHDPDLPAVSMFMERSYNTTRWMTMEMLYMTERALRLWTLDDTPIIKNALKDNPSSNITYPMLSNISKTLLDKYSRVHETRGIKPSDFHGVKVHLDQASLKSLLTDREVFISISPVFGWTTKEENPFAGKCCVRLTKSRFFMEGIKNPTDDRVLVAVTHLGRETFVDSNNTVHEFLHEQIYMHFKYIIKNGTKFVSGEEETVDADIGEKTNGEYALVSPFATWRIQVPEKLNDSALDLSGVTDAFFMFDGSFYPAESIPKPEYVL